MTFKQLLGTRATALWALMMAATVGVGWIGRAHGIADARAAGTAILLVAFVKLYLVGRHFMELRTAPFALRRALDTYALVTGALVVVGQLLLR